MQPEARDAAYLRDVVEYAWRVVRAVDGRTLDGYLADAERQMIVERGVEVIGEAANHVSPATRARYPDVQWQKIVNQRHVLAHEYGRIDQRRLWEVATVHVPALLARLEPDIAPPPPRTPTLWDDPQ